MKRRGWWLWVGLALWDAAFACMDFSYRSLYGTIGGAVLLFWAIVAGGIALRDYRKTQPQRPLPITESSDPIIAWRGWHITRRCTRLKSIYRDDIWTPGVPFAADRVEQSVKLEVVDGVKCFATSGVHAWKTLDDLLAYLKSIEEPDDHKGVYAYGAVALWGRVIEHNRGYRAEFAYPHHLYVSSTDPVQHKEALRGVAQALAREYGCEVEVAPRPIDERNS